MLAALPSPEDELRVIYDLDYGPNSHRIRRQVHTFATSGGTYSDELARARTYSLKEEAQALWDRGMCRHLTPRDVLVIGDNGPIDNTYRYEDEPVRHKILDLLGEDLAAYDFEGTSRRPAIERAEPVAGTVFATWGGLASATDGRFKLIAHRAQGTAALYDLAADPGEERDVAAAHPAEVRRLAAELEAWRRAAERDGAESEGETVEEQLKGLGYLQ